MAEEGRAGARTALALASDPGRFLSTVQIGITLVGVLAGAFVLVVLAGLYVAAAMYFGDRVPSDTRVGGVAIGGLTPERGRVALEAGADGLVCSPHEAALIRNAFGDRPMLVVPGVRPAGAEPGDQSRVATPADTIRADVGIRGGRITVNGLYRHGFLIAPALAELTLAYVERGQIDNEVMQCM